MLQNEKEPTLEDVLNEFVAERESPTVEALEIWVDRYPQFRHRKLVGICGCVGRTNDLRQNQQN